MKKLIIGLLMAVSSFTYGQLQGDIAADGRALLTETTFVIEGKLDGRIVYDIAVNSKGEVTSAKRVLSESTVKSTPIDVEVRKYVSSFEFEPGTHYPKFHQGRVIITLVKPKDVDE
jgi:hypothetical protein